MELKEERPTAIKVLLMGTPEQKKSFKYACRNRYELISAADTVGVDFMTVNGKSGKLEFRIRDGAGMERFNALTNATFKACQIIIFLNGSEAKNAQTQQKITEHKIATFDFESLSLKPLELLYGIEDAILHPLTECNDKAVLVKSAYFKSNVNSPFNLLPKEVTSYILEMMHSKYSFFAAPLSINKGLTLDAPKQAPKKEDDKTEEGFFSSFTSWFKW